MVGFNRGYPRVFIYIIIYNFRRAVRRTVINHYDFTLNIGGSQDAVKTAGQPTL